MHGVGDYERNPKNRWIRYLRELICFVTYGFEISLTGNYFVMVLVRGLSHTYLIIEPLCFMKILSHVILDEFCASVNLNNV